MTPSPLPGSTRSSWPTGHDSISPGYQQGRHTRARLDRSAIVAINQLDHQAWKGMK